MASKFSKKHYEEIAEILRVFAEDTLSSSQPAQRYVEATLLREVIESISVMFHKDNPSYSSHKFDDVCKYIDLGRVEKP